MSVLLPREMQCLVKEKECEGYELVTRPVPSPGPDEILMKVERVAICGSDLSLWKWDVTAKKIATLPFIPGHEASGEIVAIGEEVKDMKIGQRVAVENHYFCGKCYQCKKGWPSICQNMNQYGHGRGTKEGGCCQYSLVPARYCYKLTRFISPEEAVLLEPMGVAHNAVESINVENEDVLVLGCGPVGLLAMAVAKTMGARVIYGVDIVEERLETALKMGADRVINSSKEDIKTTVMKLSENNGVGRIVEASGSATILNQSFQWLRKGGQMVLIGLPKEPLHVENVTSDIIFRSITLKTVHGRRIFHTWEECERLLAEGQVDVEPLVSHNLPMTQFTDAFNLLMAGKGCKIILNPQK